MIILFYISLFALMLYIYIVFASFTVWNKHNKYNRRYILRTRKDELVDLVIKGKLNENDALFKDIFQSLESFEEVCDHVSMKHIIESMETRKWNPLREQFMKELIQKIDSSEKEVKEVLIGAFTTMGTIVIKNSFTVKFFFYLIRIALFKKIPQKIKKLVKEKYGPFVDAAKALVAYEENMNIRLIRIPFHS